MLQTVLWHPVIWFQGKKLDAREISVLPRSNLAYRINHPKQPMRCLCIYVWHLCSIITRFHKNKNILTCSFPFKQWLSNSKQLDASVMRCSFSWVGNESDEMSTRNLRRLWVSKPILFSILERYIIKHCV